MFQKKFFTVLRIRVGSSQIKIHIFPHPRSELQGAKRHQIPVPDPQHYISKRLIFFLCLVWNSEPYLLSTSGPFNVTPCLFPTKHSFF